MARRRRVARRGGVVRRRARYGGNYGFWALLVAIVVLGVAIWLTTRAGAGGGGAQPAPPTAVPTIPFVPPAPAAQIALAERQKLPATTGAPVALHDFQGRSVVLALYSAST